jgi:hypothetical protein
MNEERPSYPKKAIYKNGHLGRDRGGLISSPGSAPAKLEEYSFNTDLTIIIMTAMAFQW